MSDVVVTGVTHDSQQVRPGDLFVARPGAVTHGARFGGYAVAAGAVAVLTDDAGRSLMGDVVVPVISIPDPRERLGEIAATVYGRPADDLLLVGVTGTNGKTTTSYLVESGMRATGHKTGLIGTIETRIGDERVPSVRTTPESPDVHALLAVMREMGVTACAMEVSSHALALGRVDGVAFDVVGFTNLTQDHLDFHTDLEDYFQTKASLFTKQRARRGVVCVDDEYGRRLASEADIPVATVATHLRADSRDRWREKAATATTSGQRSRVAWQVLKAVGQPSGLDRVTLAGPRGQRVEFDVPVPGSFNVANAALAVVLLAEAGADPSVAAGGVAQSSGVPGRMERVTITGQSHDTPWGIVDYAHTPDAIENVLRALPRRGQVIAIVGAGGDRDRHKRPLMGAAAAKGADVVIVTDDNPRSEDPAAIRAAVIAGANAVPEPRRGDVVEVSGRKDAIRVGVARATGRHDIVAVLGKGHEQGQEIAGTVHPFDDREVLRHELRNWRPEAAE